MLTKIIRVTACLLIGISLLASFSTPASSQRLVYKVDVRSPESHKVTVHLQPVNIRQDSIIFQMPVWAPGAYTSTHYGNFVDNFKALDSSGHELSVERVRADRWVIGDAAALAEIVYEVRDSHSETSTPYAALANIDQNIFYANGTALFGYLNDDKYVPLTVSFTLPDNWMIATALDPAGESNDANHFHQTLYNAEDYDELVDQSIIAAPHFETEFFTERKVDYNIVVVSDQPFEMDSLTDYLHQVVRAESSFFRDVPFTDYLFMVYAPSVAAMPSLSQGGIEHRNSSAYLLPNIDWAEFKNDGLLPMADHFFQAWNAKKFHSSELGPFDYAHSIHSTSLWLPTGFTQYYAHLLLARNGVIPESKFYSAIEAWRDAATAGHRTSKSLEQLSLSIDSATPTERKLFEAKAPLVALMLDLDIRSRTNNKRSLDNIMYELNTESRKGKAFNDKELLQTMQHSAGVDLASFYSHYITGNDSLPLEAYLSKMGVSSDLPEELRLGGNLGFDLALNSAGSAIVKSVTKDSSLDSIGLKPGDTITSINGKKVTSDFWTDVAQAAQQGHPVKLSVVRNNKAVELTVHTTKAAKRRHRRLVAMKNASKTQLAIRKGLVGKKKITRKKKKALTQVSPSH